MLSLIPGLIQCPLIDCSQSQNLSKPTNCEILRPVTLSLLQNTETQGKTKKDYANNSKYQIKTNSSFCCALCRHFPVTALPVFCMHFARVLYFSGRETYSKDQWSQTRKGRHAESEAHPEL